MITDDADGHTGEALRAFATEAVHSNRKPQHTDNAARQAGRSIGATREVFATGVESMRGVRGFVGPHGS